MKPHTQFPKLLLCRLVVRSDKIISFYGRFAAVALLLAAAPAQAADQTWNGNVTNGFWSTGNNWSGGAAPGSTSNTTTTDTATFNTAIANTWGNSALNPVVIDSATQAIKNLTFDFAAGSYFVGSTTGNSLWLTTNGSILIKRSLTGTNVTETINAPLVIQGVGGNYSLTNNALNGAGAGSGTLVIGGAISANGTAGNTTLTLSGTNTNTNTNANTISGNITNGSALALAVNKSGYGTWVLAGDNTYTGATTMSNGTLSLGSALALGGGGNITFTGGTLQFSASNTTDYSSRIFNSTSAISIDTNSQTVTFGAIAATGNSGGLAKLGSGTLILNASNAYTGTTTVKNGTLQLSGAAGAIAGTSYALAGGTFAINNTAAAGGNNNARIADAATFSLAGGTLNYMGSDAATTNSTETIGAVTVGAGYSTVTITADGSNTANLTAASFARVAGNGNGTALVNGTSLGASATAPNRLSITALPTLTGTTNATPTGINSGVFNTKIVPFLVGEATATTGGLGTATGTANTFLTYNATTGLRPLNLTDEFTNNAITSGNNTYITSATAAASTVGINSLIVNGGDLTINDGVTLTNTSGAILFSGSNSIKPGGSGALTFASGTEGLVTVNSGITGTISANITATGTNALTKSGQGTLVLSGSNTYTGATTVAAGTLKIGSGASIPSGGNLTTGLAGTFDMNGNDQTLGVLNNAGIVTNSGAIKTITFGNGSSGAGNFTGAMNVVWNQTTASTTMNSSFTNTGNLTFNVNGTGNMTVGGEAPAGTLNNTGTITNSGSGAGNITIAGVIGSNVTNIIQNSANSTLTLTGNNTAMTAGIQITSGTVKTAGALAIAPSGTGTLTLGSASTPGDAMLSWGSNYATPNNPITVNGGTGNRTLRLTVAGSVTLGGNITLNGDLIVDTAAGSSNGLTLAGTIIGSNKITFTNTAGTATAASTISNSQNNFTGVYEIASGAALSLGTNGMVTTGTVNVLAGGNLTFTQGATIAGLNGQAGSFSSGGSGKTLIIGGSGNYTFAGVIQNGAGNTNGFTMNGTGTQILSGSNTYNGTTTVSAGTLRLNGASGTLLDAGNVTVSGGTLDVAQSDTVNQVLLSSGNITSSTGTGTLTGSSFILNGASNSTIGAALAGTGATFTKNGTGVVTLSGSNTYSGATTISAGTLVLSGTNNSVGNTTVSAGGTLQLTNTTANNGGLANGTLSLNGGTLQVTSAAPLAISNTVILGVSSTISGNQSLTINGSFTNSVGNRAITNSLTAGNTLVLAGPVYISENASIGRGLNLNGTGNTTVNGAIADYNGAGVAGSLTTAGGGVITLNGNNTYTGPTTIGAGTVILNGTSTSNSTIVNSVGAVFIESATGVLAGSGSTFSVGTGTSATLAGNNTYTGNTSIAGTGALNINASGTNATNSAIGTGTLTITAGTIDNTSGSAVTLATNNAITLSSFTFAGSNNLNLGTGNIAMAGNSTITANNAGVLTLGGAIQSTTAGLTKAGNGTLVLANANAYSGITTVSAGTLKINASTNLGDASATNTIAISNGGTLESTGNTYSLGATRAIALGTGNTTIQVDLGVLTVNGALSGATGTSNFIKSGSGALTLSGTNAYGNSGTFVTLSAGTLNINSASALGLGSLQIGGGTTVDNTSGAAITTSTNNAVGINGDFAFSTSAGTVNSSLTIGSTSSNVGLAADRTITLNGLGALTLGILNNNADSARTLTVNNGTGTGTTSLLSFSQYKLTTTGSTSARTDIINGTGNVAITGAVSDGTSAGSGLTYSGSGTLTLNGTNTFTGGLNIQNGTVKLTAAAGAGAGTVTLGVAGDATSGTLDLNGASRTIISLATAGTAANQKITNSAATAAILNYTGAGTSTFGGVIENGIGGNTTALTVNNAGANLILTGANTYTGNTTVSAGTLSLQHAGGGTLASTTNVKVNNIGTLDVAQNNTVGAVTVDAGGTISGVGTLNATSYSVGSSVGTVNISANLTGTGALTSTFTGTGVALSGNNSGWSGTIGQTGSTGLYLIVNNKNAMGTGAVYLSGNLSATADLSGTNAIANNIFISNGGAGVSGTNNITLNGSVTQATNSAPALLNTITGGTLELAGPVYLSESAGTGRTLKINGTGNTLISGVISNFNGTGSTGSFTANSTGITTLTASNTYNGTTTVSAGTLSLAHAGGTLADTGNVTVSGGTLDVAQSDTVNVVTLSNGTISGPGTLTASSFSLSGPGTISAILAGVGTPLAKTGAGTTTILSGNNAYTGITSINGGVLSVSYIGNGNGTGNLGAAASDNANINLAATLQYTGSGESTDRLFRLGAFTTDTLDASGTGAITFSNTGSLGNAGSNGARTFTLTGNNTSNNTLNPKISDVNTNAGNATTLVKSGIGTWVLAGNNTYTGTTTISGGTLQFAKQTSLYSGNNTSWTAANVIVASGGTLALNVGGSGEFTTGNVTTLLANLGGANGTSTTGLAAGSKIAFDTTNASGSTFTVSDVIANSTGAGGGAIGLIKLGTNTLVLTGNNSYSGNTTVNGGKLVLSDIFRAGQSGNVTLNAGTTLGIYDGSGLGVAPSGVIFAGNSTLQFQKSTSGPVGASRRMEIASGVTATIDTQGFTDSFNAPFTGNGTGGALTKIGSGTLTLNGINTYTGLTTVTAGALNISSSGSLASGNALALGTGGTADFANAGQTLGTVANANTASNALNFSASTGTATLASLTGSGSTRFGSNGAVTGGISSGTVISVGALAADISGGTVTAGGLLTGNITSGTVGAGSLSASSVSGGTNTITGAANIATLSNGTTTVGGVATIGTMTVGTANLNGTTSAITTLNGGSIALGGSTALTVSNGSTSGAISGGGSLTKATSGTLTLTGNNTYTGPTNVTGGTLLLGNGGTTGSLSASSAITDNGNLAVNRSNSVVQGTDFSSAAISGNGSFTQFGTGTTTLTAANTYTGATNVTAGTLFVDGNQTSATGNVTVASGASLGGNGTLGGETTIAGILSPGEGGIGTLNIANNVTWQGAATAGSSTDWIFQLGAGNTSDLLHITGNFLKDTSLGTAFRFDFGSSTNTGTFKLADWSGSSSFNAGDFSFTNLGSGLTGSFSMTGTELDFTALGAVPEPSTWVAMATLVLTGGVVGLRRRSR